MRFLLDESADLRLARHLLSLGHDVTTVAHDHTQSVADPQVLSIAHRERRILITEDRDFGELVFRFGRAHAGVILFRFGSADLPTKIARLDYVLAHDADRLDQFLVVGQRNVRVHRPGP